jgi:hypothetical protein
MHAIMYVCAQDHLTSFTCTHLHQIVRDVIRHLQADMHAVHLRVSKLEAGSADFEEAENLFPRCVRRFMFASNECKHIPMYSDKHKESRPSKEPGQKIKSPARRVRPSIMLCKTIFACVYDVTIQGCAWCVHVRIRTF